MLKWAKIHIFRRKFKISNCMPSSPCEPNVLNLVCGVSITNLTICGGDGLNLNKSSFFNNPSVQSTLCPLYTCPFFETGSWFRKAVLLQALFRSSFHAHFTTSVTHVRTANQAEIRKSSKAKYVGGKFKQSKQITFSVASITTIQKVGLRTDEHYLRAKSIQPKWLLFYLVLALLYLTKVT